MPPKAPNKSYSALIGNIISKESALYSSSSSLSPRCPFRHVFRYTLLPLVAYTRVCIGGITTSTSIFLIYSRQYELLTEWKKIKTVKM